MTSYPALRKFVAPELIFGIGAAELAGQHIANLSARKVLFVTDEGMLKTPWPQMVMDSLSDEGVSYTLFSNVTPNPRDSEVMNGAEVFQKNRCEAIVVVGGGSAIDCAKAIGIVNTNRQNVLEFEGVDMVGHPGPPLVCVPTTSGSAADVSQFCIINDTARKVKIAIVSKTMVPDVSLIDPLLTTTMSPELTAHTGLDALTHAVEAYVSNANSPFTDLHALESVRQSATHLQTAIEEPQNLDARSGMSLASTYAGLAFSNAILGAVHAMSHSLGGMLDLPHGLCNAILLDHVIEFNFEAVPERYSNLARALGADIPEDMPVKDAKAATLEAFRDIKKRCGVEVTLAELGVGEEEIAALAATAINDPCMLTNPRQAIAAELEGVYGKAR
ncbi:alcohol dehydrogenase-like regulatory protein ErcA [Salidesulfovibrio brasiliensis]|uniref:alcohol dehydrogenase-like regulatory protein ErcA n=1 Tax=Salidesulfovibrio brasiliensis TaxID=221711 RepID=UPI0006D05815|nr:alcohol dehydrogenase-like regulatory protein ErcA [Salidesulfovibrio brasiliensis]